MKNLTDGDDEERDEKKPRRHSEINNQTKHVFTYERLCGERCHQNMRTLKPRLKANKNQEIKDLLMPL